MYPKIIDFRRPTTPSVPIQQAQQAQAFNILQSQEELVIQIADGADDGFVERVNGNILIYTSQTEFYVERSSAYLINGLLRFPIPPLGPDREIVQANLWLAGHTSHGLSTPGVQLIGEIIDEPWPIGPQHLREELPSPEDIAFTAPASVLPDNAWTLQEFPLDQTTLPRIVPGQYLAFRLHMDSSLTSPEDYVTILSSERDNLNYEPRLVLITDLKTSDPPDDPEPEPPPPTKTHYRVLHF